MESKFESKIVTARKSHSDKKCQNYKSIASSCNGDDLLQVLTNSYAAAAKRIYDRK